jgi:hypothetical protein
MAEKYYFFDETATDLREYNADDYAKYFRQFLSDGVYKKDAISNLGVTASGTNMTVSVGVGTAFVQGYMYENDADLTMTHDAAEATLDRIDRIVLRLDKTAENRYVRLFVKKGTADSAPVAPSLQQDSFIHEIAVAQILITAGKSFIEQTQVTDERVYVTVSQNVPYEGAIKALDLNSQDLKNVSTLFFSDYSQDDVEWRLLEGGLSGSIGNFELRSYNKTDNSLLSRAMSIHTQGTLSLPKQSYISLTRTTDLTVNSGVDTQIPFETIYTDVQSEISGNQIVCKDSGSYLLTTNLQWTSSFPNSYTQLLVYKDGAYQFTRNIGFNERNINFSQFIDFVKDSAYSFYLKQASGTNHTLDAIHLQFIKVV